MKAIVKALLRVCYFFVKEKIFRIKPKEYKHDN